MLLRSFAIHFSVDIIYELRSEVQQVYFLITSIIYQSGYISEISLLGVLYLLLPHCSWHPDRQSKPRLWKGLQTGHAIFICVLSVLWVAAFALKIKYQVDFVIGNPFSEFHSVVEPYQKIDTVYAILYFLGSFEVLAWSVLGVVDSKKRKEKGQVSDPTTPQTP